MKSTSSKLMKVKKAKGTTKIEQIVKPEPIAVHRFTLDFWDLVDYLNNVDKGIANAALDFWQEKQVFAGQPTRVYLPLPTEEEPYVTKVLLEQYPEWESIEFEVSYE